MRSVLALGVLMVGAIAAPASAELAFTLPGGYRSFDLRSGGTEHVAKGGFVHIVWFGRSGKFFAMKFEAGGAYLKDERGDSYSYAVGQGSANLQVSLGPLTPYVGVLGHAGYPFQQPADVTGIPYGVMPQVGIGLDIGIARLDVHAAEGPVWGLSNPQSGSYAATLTEIGGQVGFGF